MSWVEIENGKCLDALGTTERKAAGFSPCILRDEEHRAAATRLAGLFRFQFKEFK